MKKWIAVLSAAVLCLSLAVALLSAAVLRLSFAVSGGKNDASVSSDASANSVVDRKDGASASSNAPANTVANGKDDASVSSGTPANIVVDGKEIPVKDFLITYLSDYIQSDAYLAKKAKYEKIPGQEAPPFTVTYAFELKVDGWGSENQPLHFFMVKANCVCFMGGIWYDSITMAIDYDTGTVYDRYSVDESWMEKSEKEQAIYIAVEGGYFVDPEYDGELIFGNSETHISLSDSDIAEINQALYQ